MTAPWRVQDRRWWLLCEVCAPSMSWSRLSVHRSRPSSPSRAWIVSCRRRRSWRSGFCPCSSPIASCLPTPTPDRCCRICHRSRWCQRPPAIKSPSPFLSHDSKIVLCAVTVDASVFDQLPVQRFSDVSSLVWSRLGPWHHRRLASADWFVTGSGLVMLWHGFVRLQTCVWGEVTVVLRM